MNKRGKKSAMERNKKTMVKAASSVLPELTTIATNLSDKKELNKDYDGEGSYSPLTTQ